MTNISLEKIDLVRERTGASYEVALELLSEHDGNVVEAIIAYEKKHREVEEYEVTNNKLIEKIKSLIHEGNVSRITIKQNGEVVLNIPVNLGIAAIVLAPFLAILAGIAAVASSCTIVVERRKGKSKCDTEETDS